MAAQGINPGGASPLDRFQQIRDLARKKIDASSSTRGDENRARLADLLKRKQAELGQGTALDRPHSAPRAAAAHRMENTAGGIDPAGSGGAGGPAAYGRAGGMERKPAGQGLGRYIDLTA